MFSKLAYSTPALTVSLGTVMSCQAEVTGKDVAAAFDHPQQINAGDLNIGYVDIGPKRGTAGDSVTRLALRYSQLCRSRTRAGGKRLPGHCALLRGYGTTRFLSASTPRNGQPSAMAKDIVNLMDALNIKQAVLRDMTGAPVRRTLSRRCGLNASNPLFR